MKIPIETFTIKWEVPLNLMIQLTLGALGVLDMSSVNQNLNRRNIPFIVGIPHGQLVILMFMFLNESN